MMTVSLTQVQKDAAKSKSNSGSRIATIVKFLTENIDKVFKSKSSVYSQDSEPTDDSTGFVWFKPSKDELKMSLLVGNDRQWKNICTISNKTLLESQLAITNRLTVLEDNYIN